MVAMFALLTTILLSTLPQQGTIAFISNTDTGAQLCVFDVATEAVTPLGPGSDDAHPRWSPDGTRIAFTTHTDEGTRIAVAYPEEERYELLPNAASLNRSPRWNANGQYLAYESGLFPDTSLTVYSFSTNSETIWGGNAQRLMRPVWTSNDNFLQSSFIEKGATSRLEQSSLLAIQLTQTSEGDSWTTRLVAVTQEQIFPIMDWVYDFPDEEHTEWSVEPSRGDQALAYESNDGGDRELFIARKGAVFDVSNHRAADWNPTWSPDGKWVAYDTFRNSRRAVYRAHRDSGRHLPIAQHENIDYWAPFWLPDSEHLIYLQEENNYVQLVLSTADASESRVLSIDVQEIRSPQWKPE